MKKVISLIHLAAFIFIFSINANAQTKLPVCGWSLPATDAKSVFKRQLADKRLRQYIAINQQQDVDTLYTLPIVVHVIHTGTAIGSPDNPTDAQINAMIQLLNNTWRKAGAPYGGADMKIQFQLAIRSPQCGTTTGINRINGSAVPNYSTGGITASGFPGSADQVLVKNLSRWSNTDYINIWIVNKIDGSSTNIGGYAYFAQYNDAAIDGIVLNASVVNGTNKTIAHEMGHVFELYHTFYDDAFETNCPRVDSCNFYGDRVCDTEGSKVEYFCSNNTNNCTGAPYTIADPQYNYSTLNNYMSYADCPWMFTEGQKARVRAALLAFRPGLINSGALKPPSGISPAVACTPTASFSLSPYYGIEKVVFNTLNVYSNSSEGDKAFYTDRTCNQQTVVEKGMTYSLQIMGSFANPHTFKAYLDYNNDGDFNDPGETLVSDYTDTARASITIPSSGIQTGVPLRLRVVADNPAPGYPTFPTACLLNGTAGEGSGQIEDYSVIVASGAIQSIATGLWNNPGTWNCNCIPTYLDQVSIKNGHTVTVTSAMGLVECSRLIIETGGSFNVNSNGQFKQRR